MTKENQAAASGRLYLRLLLRMFGTAPCSCRISSYSKYDRTRIPYARETSKVGRTEDRTACQVALDVRNSNVGCVRSSGKSPICGDSYLTGVALSRPSIGESGNIIKKSLVQIINGHCTNPFTRLFRFAA